MLTELVIAAAVLAVASALGEMISTLLEVWGQQELPQTDQAEMSEFDRQQIARTQELIAARFGTDVVGRLREASNKERIALVADFAEELAIEYGLDIQVDVTVNEESKCGYYSWEQKKAVFNIALLMTDGNSDRFAYCVRETLDTIAHEFRHAVQHRAIEEPGFWNASEAQRGAWARNMTPGQYIRPEVDMRGYAAQPIENDAATFAALVMEGVK